MLNQIVLIGRLATDLEIKQTETGKKFCEGKISVRRGFKNQDGKYDTDFIEFTMMETLATNFLKLAEKGNTIALKGRIQPHEIAVGENTISVNRIIVEKFTCI